MYRVYYVDNVDDPDVVVVFAVFCCVSCAVIPGAACWCVIGASYYIGIRICSYITAAVTDVAVYTTDVGALDVVCVVVVGIHVNNTYCVDIGVVVCCRWLWWLFRDEWCRLYRLGWFNVVAVDVRNIVDVFVVVDNSDPAHVVVVYDAYMRMLLLLVLL